MFIFLFLLIVGIVGIILYDNTYNTIFDNEYVLGGSVIATVLGAIGMFILAILIIVFNSQLTIATETASLEAQQLSINATYEYLTSNEYHDISIVEITNYNKEVAEFKSKIISTKISRNNPWINWLVCPAACAFDENSVKYIDRGD